MLILLQRNSYFCCLPQKTHIFAISLIGEEYRLSYDFARKQIKGLSIYASNEGPWASDCVVESQTGFLGRGYPYMLKSGHHTQSSDLSDFVPCSSQADTDPGIPFIGSSKYCSSAIRVLLHFSFTHYPEIMFHFTLSFFEAGVLKLLGATATYG